MSWSPPIQLDLNVRFGKRDARRTTINHHTNRAAVAFTLISFMSAGVATPVWTVVSFTALIAALWFTLGGLNVSDRKVRIGATLLGAAATIWTEPVFRNIYLGQINLVLMALILLWRPRGLFPLAEHH